VKVLVAVGMTGGHIIPGIAVAEELKRLESGSDVVFAGTVRGRASELVSNSGYRYIQVPVRGWAGVGAVGKLLFLFFMFLSFLSAFIALLREKPRVVVGTGSYAMLPFALCAVLLNLPLFLLEQNVVPGKATKFLSRFATEVHVAYEESVWRLSKPGRAHVSGNPIRKTHTVKDRASLLREYGLEPGLKTILVFGGSRGARSINRAFASALKLLEQHGGLQFIAQTGEEDLDHVEKACKETRIPVHITPFIYEMSKAYACADLVVCRAGATTIAELTGNGLPSILIPYPFSAGGHQEKNAAFLAEVGASIVLRDQDLSGKILSDRIIELIADPERLATMREISLKLARRDAARRVSESILAIGKAIR
jgi:UDP-N-acetylglucosamine--N-acetylmuramyl-(pentapeptide) pyrophosphoryl-undecaprenol N-acetylglucosamine transferase